MALHLHIAAPLEKLAAMLSQSAAVQTLLGVETAEAASEKIHYGYGEDEEYETAYTAQQPKPLPRIICALSDFTSTKETTSSWGTKVEIDVMIETLTLSADAQKSTSARYLEFLHLVEGVADDLRDQAASGTKLTITDMSTIVAPQQADPKKTRAIGQVFWCVFRVTAGGADSMLDMSAIIEDSNLSERAVNQVVKLAGSLTMQEHRGRLPGHFEFSAFAKYGYKKRTKKYQIAKAKKFGTTAPLVRTGALRASMLRNARITATANKAELKSKGSKTAQLMSQFRQELESFTPEEEKQNAESFRDKFVTLSSDPSLRRKRKTKV